MAAFLPLDDEEKSRHAAIHKDLGVDPCLGSEKLKKDAECVAGVLCADGDERGLTDTPLDVLKERGRDYGVADYLGELETRAAPPFRQPKWARGLAGDIPRRTIAACEQAAGAGKSAGRDRRAGGHCHCGGHVCPRGP